MKIMTAALAAALLSGSLAGSMPATAADYTVDMDHSSVGFSIRHMISRVQGNFRKFSGAFSFDEKKLDASKVSFTADASSIDTNNKKRDDHLKSPDFFDVQKCPELKFTSTKVEKEGDKKMKATGELTMHCVTKPATFEIEYTGSTKDPWGNMKAGFAATSKLNRKDWGINWNKALDAGGVMLGDEVEIRIDVEAAQNKAEGAETGKKEAASTKSAPNKKK